MTEISDETYEELRKILEQQNCKAYSLEETKQIGAGLLEFFHLLQKIDHEQATPRENPPRS